MTGKDFERMIAKSYLWLYRLYDNFSSFGSIPAQPGDFVIPKAFIECKYTKGSYFRKVNFWNKSKRGQIAKQVEAQAKGIPVIYVLRFGDLDETLYVPFTYIYNFIKGPVGRLHSDTLKQLSGVTESLEECLNYCLSKRYQLIPEVLNED